MKKEIKKKVREEKKKELAKSKTAVSATDPSPITPMITTKLDKEQVALIKRTICVGGTDDELALFIYNCNRTQLDPFARQIYAVRRYNALAGREVMTTQISIDGQRIVAKRSGMYRGQTKTEWCDESGKWMDVWLKKTSPAAARIGVHHAQFAETLYAVARFDAYAQRKKDGTLMHMWAEKGDIMIGKCAEALALRKAFPQELSGMYTSEEMGDEGVQYDIEAKAIGAEEEKIARGFATLMQMVESPKVTADQLGELHQKMNASDKYSDDQKAQFNAAMEKKLNRPQNKNTIEGEVVVHTDENGNVETSVAFQSEAEENSTKKA